MKIVVLGIGRSGTTAIYGLLQQILSNATGNKTEYVYEPFLWERDVFNIDIRQAGDKFLYQKNISVEGIYNHKKIPLMIRDTDLPISNKFISDLMNAHDKENSILIKFIRANGRYRLLKSLHPDSKFIFVIRNPIDVLNSSSQLFSLNGDDMYPSDYPKLAREVKEIYDRNISIQNEDYDIDKEYQWWFWLNKFAIESFDSDVLKICYDDFNLNKKKYVKKICKFIDVKYKGKYYSYLKDKISHSVKKKIGITKLEYENLMGRFGDYLELIVEFDLFSDFDISSIEKKYNNAEFLWKRHLPGFGQTNLQIRGIYERILQQNRIKF